MLIFNFTMEVIEEELTGNVCFCKYIYIDILNLIFISTPLSIEGSILVQAQSAALDWQVSIVLGHTGVIFLVPNKGALQSWSQEWSCFALSYCLAPKSCVLKYFGILFGEGTPAHTSLRSHKTFTFLWSTTFIYF